MTVLNNANKIIKGSSQASAVYAGTNKVWPKAIPLALGVSLSTTSNTSSSVTTQTSGSSFLVVVTGAVGAPSLAVTDNKGNTYTLVATLSNSFASSAALYICQDGVGGAGHTFTQGGVNLQSMSVIEIKGGLLRDHSALYTNGAGPWSTGSATSVAGDIAVGLLGYDYSTNGTTGSAGSGFTLRTQSTTASNLHSVISTATASGSSIATTFNSSPAGLRGFAFMATMKQG